MQTTAIRTVAYLLPKNEVNLLTLLISKRYILNTDLHKNSDFQNVFQKKDKGKTNGYKTKKRNR